MVPVLGLSLEREVCGVLVRRVVPQGELDCSAVHTRVEAVGPVEASEPGDAAQQLTTDGGRALWVTVGLVKEDGAAGTTVVGHLRGIF